MTHEFRGFRELGLWNPVASCLGLPSSYDSSKLCLLWHAPGCCTVVKKEAAMPLHLSGVGCLLNRDLAGFAGGGEG